MPPRKSPLIKKDPDVPFSTDAYVPCTWGNHHASHWPSCGRSCTAAVVAIHLTHHHYPLELHRNEPKKKKKEKL